MGRYEDCVLKLNGTIEEKKAAIRVLGALNDDQRALEKLVELLNVPDREIKFCVVQALEEKTYAPSRTDVKGAFEPLLRTLGEAYVRNDSEIQRFAAYALGSIILRENEDYRLAQERLLKNFSDPLIQVLRRDINEGREQGECISTYTYGLLSSLEGGEYRTTPMPIVVDTFAKVFDACVKYGEDDSSAYSVLLLLDEIKGKFGPSIMQAIGPLTKALANGYGDEEFQRKTLEILGFIMERYPESKEKAVKSCISALGSKNIAHRLKARMVLDKLHISRGLVSDTLTREHSLSRPARRVTIARALCYMGREVIGSLRSQATPIDGMSTM